MQQVSFKCETPQLELKSLWTFLAVKHSQRTKNGKVITTQKAQITYWSRQALRRHEFDEMMPPEVWASLCIFTDATIVGY